MSRKFYTSINSCNHAYRDFKMLPLAEYPSLTSKMGVDRSTFLIIFIHINMVVKTNNKLTKS